MSTIKLMPFLRRFIQEIEEQVAKPDEEELTWRESRAPYAEPDDTSFGVDKEIEPMKKVVV